LRALLPAVADRGHQVVYFEAARDGGTTTDYTFCRVVRYDEWEGVKRIVEGEVEKASAVLVTSGFAPGASGIDWLLDLDVPARLYYTLDPWAELRAFEEEGASPWLRADQVEAFDLVFSLAGGPALEALQKRWNAKEVAPLYETIDPAVYYPRKPAPDAASDLALVADYDSAVEATLREYMLTAAEVRPSDRFVVAGKGWNTGSWPDNVELFEAADDDGKALIYSSARLVLVPVLPGSIDHALPPELLEPIACGTTAVAVHRPGLEDFFTPGREILVPSSPVDVIAYLTTDQTSLLSIANNAEKRLLEKYSKLPRSRQFEQRVAKKFFGA
jgi:spore maturation protein CgeB